MVQCRTHIRNYFSLILLIFFQAFVAGQGVGVGCGSDGDGAFVGEKQASEWQFFTYENTSLPDWPFHHVLVDHYDNIWAGTSGGGLVKYDGAVWTVYNKKNSPLPHNHVGSLAMDHYGNIWIGTGDGLAKFDGNNWEVYNTDNSEIPEGIITSIAFDSNNDIWLSTAFYLDDVEYSWWSCEESKLVKVEGLSVLHDPVWTFYDNTELASYFVSEMAFDATGNLWLNYSKGVLVKFDGSQFTEYNIFGYTGIGHNICFTIDQDNIIWTGDWEGTLIKFDGTNAAVTEPGFPDEGEPRFDYLDFRSLAVDENNNLWLGTGLGLIKYNGSSWTYYKLEAITYSSDFTSTGVLWAGSDNNSLYAFEEGVSLNWYWRSNTGLPINDVTAVKCDGSDNSWIGLYHGGVSRFDGVFWKVFNENNSGLPDNHITAIEEDDQKNIWIGTTKGLAVKQAIALPGEEWIVYTPYNSALPGLSIRCLHYGNGNLWAGTSLGLTRFDGENWETFNSDNSMLPDDGVRAITIDNDGNIWVGTYSSGLYKIPALSLNEPNWKIYNTDNSDLPHNGVRALEADSMGYIWIGTLGGLAGFDGEAFTVYDAGNSDLPGNHVQSLHLDKDNKLWIGMLYDGVAKFDGTDWTLFNHENSDIPMGALWSLDMDQYGNMWFGIDGGGVAVYNEAGIASRNNLVLSGQLFLDGGDTPLDESVVELYRMGSAEYSKQLILSDTNAYAFTGLEYGQYTIKVIPDTLTYPETLPTWLGYKLARVHASYVTLAYNITGNDITVVQRPPAGSGTGTVTGTLFESNIVKSVPAEYSKAAEYGAPLGDCYVFLLDPQDFGVKAFDITSAGGEFVFRNLDAGQYVFYTDYKGLYMNISNPHLEIGDSNDTLEIAAVAGAGDISIQVEVVSNTERILKSALKVYPVPAKEWLTIDFGDDNPELNVETISIIDLNGKIVYKWDSPVWIGSQTEIDVSHFKTGIYFLRIQRNDTCLYLQIIKN
jgi:ligand-binding sensor domain-containing protein